MYLFLVFPDEMTSDGSRIDGLCSCTWTDVLASTTSCLLLDPDSTLLLVSSLGLVMESSRNTRERAIAATSSWRQLHCFISLPELKSIFHASSSSRVEARALDTLMQEELVQFSLGSSSTLQTFAERNGSTAILAFGIVS